MTAIPQPTAIDGYRWLKNDIIRGVYQPDEKLRMSLLTTRYGLGVGPLREALSQLVAERLVTVVNQKGYNVASMSEKELLDIFDARANMEAMLVRLAIERGDDAWEAEILPARICSANWKPTTPVKICWMNGIAAIRRSIRQLSPAVVHIICCKCANDYLIWPHAIVLSGCAQQCCLSKCWKINMTSISN